MGSHPKSFLSPGLVRREHAHRRLLLLGMSSLLLLSILPTFGHHLADGGEVPVGRIEHLGAFCAAALRIMLTPVHGAFHLALLVGMAYAIWDRFAAWRSVSAILGSLSGHSPVRGTHVWNAALRAGVDTSRVVVVTGLPNPAFTAGLWVPRIFVSSVLEVWLAQDEIDSVIAHEAAHLRRKDPLRLSTYRFLSCLLFWMPALKGLAADMADEAEIEADDAAAEAGPLALASAILRLASNPCAALTPNAVVGFYRRDLLDRRIRRLAGENTPLPTRLSRGSLTLAAFAVVMVLLSGLSAAQGTGAEAAAAAGNHCDRHGNLWSHLWCSPGDCDGHPAHCDHIG